MQVVMHCNVQVLVFAHSLDRLTIEGEWQGRCIISNSRIVNLRVKGTVMSYNHSQLEEWFRVWNGVKILSIVKQCSITYVVSWGIPCWKCMHAQARHDWSLRLSNWRVYKGSDKVNNFVVYNMIDYKIRDGMHKSEKLVSSSGHIGRMEIIIWTFHSSVRSRTVYRHACVK